MHDPIIDTLLNTSLSYSTVLHELKPHYVVHGDDWRNGVQKDIRTEVINILAEYGGQLIEFPYSHKDRYEFIEQRLNEIPQ